jgi:hypothetical protein
VRVYFPLGRRLAIQVDGVTHGRRCMSGRPAQAQGESDYSFVDTGIRSGWNVLRLDYMHSNESWRVALERALNATPLCPPVRLACSPLLLVRVAPIMAADHHGDAKQKCSQLQPEHGRTLQTCAAGHKD